VELKYPVTSKFTGRVTNITDYGAFVELEPGVEGLVHVSEMSWTKKNVHPGKIVSTSQEVDVMVLDVDPTKRRISLGLKQTQEIPWDEFSTRFPSAPKSKARSQHHRVRPVRRPAGRYRRHGSLVRHLLGEVWRGSAQAL
jgi:ribosomal protein S1